ncbi:MAG TPA: hypothetical protein HA226_05345 [Nanoarchaeota archaeon]|nr:MAG: hypothetical protein QT09_C0013G0007 [archaeon GW2011_AR18]HIH26166.1 hypothetical protein [Nanoarchaeota archaeon]
MLISSYEAWELMSGNKNKITHNHRTRIIFIHIQLKNSEAGYDLIRGDSL